MKDAKFKIGDKVCCRYQYIDFYNTMTIKDIKTSGLFFFKKYKYFVVDEKLKYCEWVGEDRLFVL